MKDIYHDGHSALGTPLPPGGNVKDRASAWYTVCPGDGGLGTTAPSFG